MSDEIGIHDDMDKPIRTAFSITAKRVEHYDDVVEFMTRDAIKRYVDKYKEKPKPRQVMFAKKEIARLAIISRDLISAQSVQIPRLST